MMVCGQNEKYLEKSLNELDRLCDDVVIAGNNIDPKSRKMIEDKGFWFYEDNREWGIHQPSIKTDLLARVGGLKPDWVVAIDADEVFAPEFTREKMEELTKRKEIAYHFLVVNLYNDPDHFYHGEGIQRFWNVRLFKYLPHLGLQYQKKSLHCGLAPPIMYKYGWHAPYYLEHYGLMLREDRMRKVERYHRFDPNAQFKSRVYYDDLAKDLTPQTFDRVGLLNKLAVIPDTQPRDIPKSLWNMLS